MSTWSEKVRASVGGRGGFARGKSGVSRGAGRRSAGPGRSVGPAWQAREPLQSPLAGPQKPDAADLAQEAVHVPI